MSIKGKKFVPFLLIMTGLIFLLFLVMQPLTILRFQEKIDVLFPKGMIAFEERNLLHFKFDKHVKVYFTWHYSLFLIRCKLPYDVYNDSDYMVFRPA